jgi:serine/threonine protein kinase
MPGASDQVQSFAVPHVATMLCGGDVYYADDQTTPQTTRLHKLVDDDDENRRPMQQYIHFRMVLKEVGEPLEKFESVPDLLQVISDVVVGAWLPSPWRVFVSGLSVAVSAHMYARKRGVLHRDISSRNVLIVRDPQGRARGLLIDWDLSYDEKRDSAEERCWITVHFFVVWYRSSITHI